jgi:mandelate racemase
VPEAIAIASRIEDVGLAWLEDPTSAIDHQGLAEIASALAMPVCAGEYLYGIEPQRQSLVHRSVDIVMIDVLRAGGITGWMKIAAMAEAFNRPVVSHLLPEVQVHTVAAAPNGLVIEYMPWTYRLFEEPPMPVNGEMTVPSAPGLGLKFAADLFTKYGIA